MAFTVAVKLLGFAEKQVIAFYFGAFGAGPQIDAYYVALSVGALSRAKRHKAMAWTGRNVSR